MKLRKYKKALAIVEGSELTIKIIDLYTDLINGEYVDCAAFEFLCDGDWEVDFVAQHKIQIIEYISKEDKPKFKDVKFEKYEEHCMGEYRTFWKAIYHERTIVTLCRTKAQCMEEARKELKNL